MKLTREELNAAFDSVRFDHPGRRSFALAAPSMRGAFYPNPPGCVGLRRVR